MADDVVRGRGRLLHVTFDDAFASTARTVANLAARGVPSTIFVCTRLADDGGAPLVVEGLEEEFRNRPSELRTLSWAELSELSADQKVEIGSHTVSHARLWELSDHELAAELHESKTSVEDHIGQPCRFLAYPFGRADVRVIRAARQAGYTAAFLLLNGSWSDPHALPRIDLYPPDRGLKLLLKTEPAVALPIAALLRHMRRLNDRRARNHNEMRDPAGPQR